MKFHVYCPIESSDLVMFISFHSAYSSSFLFSGWSLDIRRLLRRGPAQFEVGTHLLETSVGLSILLFLFDELQ